MNMAVLAVSLSQFWISSVPVYGMLYQMIDGVQWVLCRHGTCSYVVHLEPLSLHINLEKLLICIFSPQFHKERTEMYHVNGFVWSKHQTHITTAVVMKGIYWSFMGEFIFHRCVFPNMLIRFSICNTHMYIWCYVFFYCRKLLQQIMKKATRKIKKMINLQLYVFLLLLRKIKE